jgi:hypothetical protein
VSAKMALTVASSVEIALALQVAPFCEQMRAITVS